MQSSLLRATCKVAHILRATSSIVSSASLSSRGPNWAKSPSRCSLSAPIVTVNGDARTEIWSGPAPGLYTGDATPARDWQPRIPGRSCEPDCADGALAKPCQCERPKAYCQWRPLSSARSPRTGLRTGIRPWASPRRSRATGRGPGSLADSPASATASDRSR